MDRQPRGNERRQRYDSVERPYRLPSAGVRTRPIHRRSPRCPSTQPAFPSTSRCSATSSGGSTKPKVLDYLETFNEADFEGAETRAITLSFMPGKVIEGRDYLHEMSLPNFYFHLATAYSILRHNGVDVGKNDFIGHLSLRPA